MDGSDSRWRGDISSVGAGANHRWRGAIRGEKESNQRRRRALRGGGEQSEVEGREHWRREAMAGGGK